MAHIKRINEWNSNNKPLTYDDKEWLSTYFKGKKKLVVELLDFIKSEAEQETDWENWDTCSWCDDFSKNYKNYWVKFSKKFRKNTISPETINTLVSKYLLHSDKLDFPNDNRAYTYSMYDILSLL